MSEETTEEIEADVESLLGDLESYEDIEEMLEDVVDDPDSLGDADSFTSAFDSTED